MQHSSDIIVRSVSVAEEAEQVEEEVDEVEVEREGTDCGEFAEAVVGSN